ncbi:MAG: type B 50S ribosomal protein L31 [Candidatus Eremiobacteraeota bacterium]|nr:type B 50S ribosomal protein L31 [Candidatus Eremiobacteraeota bacterium]
MKKEIQPQMYNVIYKDISSDFAFLSQSTTSSKETMEWEDGKEYPVIKVEISSASHPFYTGKVRAVAAEGRVQRFMKRYGKS